MLATRLTEFVGCAVPIQQAGTGSAAPPGLAATRRQRHGHAHSQACEVTDFDVAKEMVGVGGAGIARGDIACTRDTSFFRYPGLPARN